MPETPEPTDAMFPTLDGGQIERLASSSTRRHAPPSEILFDRGGDQHGVFIVLEGRIELVGFSNDHESVLRVLGPRAFTGSESTLGPEELGPMPGARSERGPRTRPDIPPPANAD